MFTIPLYFQTSANASVTVAGVHLFPAVAGNAIGGILVGILIKRLVDALAPFLTSQDNSGLCDEICAHIDQNLASLTILPIQSGILTLCRTGRYRLPTVGAAVVASIGYLLLILRWHGNTNIWESLYIIPGGFGTGVALSTTFIALTASIASSDMAIAAAGLYQAQNIGVVVGLSITSAILQGTLRPMLDWRLNGFKDKSTVSLPLAICYVSC